MKLRCVAMLAAWLLWGISAWSGPILYSSFDAGTEGWSITSLQIPGGGGTPLAQVGGGGVGGSGFVWTEDTANGRLWFVAPGAWTGDYYQGSLSFYLLNPNPNVISTEPRVRISGGGQTVYYFGGSAPGSDWVFDSAPLQGGPGWYVTPESWIVPFVPATPAEVQTVMSGITSIWINADWVSRYWGHPLGDDGHDLTSLDEVRLTPIPEPASYLLAVVGLLLLVLRRRVAA
jgi:hypothetical protein